MRALRRSEQNVRCRAVRDALDGLERPHELARVLLDFALGVEHLQNERRGRVRRGLGGRRRHRTAERPARGRASGGWRRRRGVGVGCGAWSSGGLAPLLAGASGGVGIYPRAWKFRRPLRPMLLRDEARSRAFAMMTFY